MQLKKIITSFLTVFAVTLLVSVGITFLWNLFLHGMPFVSWATSFQLAIILGITFALINNNKE